MYADLVNKEEIGRRLRRIRERPPKITLEQVSNATGHILSPQRISNYEQGLRLLKAREAQLIADAYTSIGRPVTAAELLGIDEAVRESVAREPDARYHINVRNLADAIALVEEAIPREEFPALTDADRAVVIEQVYRAADTEGRLPMAKVIQIMKPIKERFRPSRG